MEIEGSIAGTGMQDAASVLTLARTLAICDMGSREQAKAIMDAIAQTAKDKWGDDWVPALVNAYCDLEKAETGNEKATLVNRRNQVLSAIEEGNPRLATVMRLATAVGITVELAIVRREVKQF